MPRGDGTGPFGQGPAGGRGLGRGAGRRRMGGNYPGSGLGGNCVCASCGEKIVHQAGVPCASINCPKCGSKMVRE